MSIYADLGGHGFRLAGFVVPSAFVFDGNLEFIGSFPGSFPDCDLAALVFQCLLCLCADRADAVGKTALLARHRNDLRHLDGLCLFLQILVFDRCSLRLGGNSRMRSLDDLERSIYFVYDPGFQIRIEMRTVKIFRCYDDRWFFDFSVDISVVFILYSVIDTFFQRYAIEFYNSLRLDPFAGVSVCRFIKRYFGISQCCFGLNLEIDICTSSSRIEKFISAIEAFL